MCGNCRGVKKKNNCKLKIALVIGGKSFEHEISLRSGRSIYENLNRNIYDIELFYISKKGKWQLLDFYPQKALEPLHDESIPQDVFEALKKCELVMPILHGPYGEDGIIQGLFEMLSLPYVGCNHKASAIAMDKAITKYICQANNIKTSPFISLSKYAFYKSPKRYLDEIEERLQFPLYIKPAHLGSAVGVTKVADKTALAKVILETFKYDEKIIVENEIVGREIEFAVIGNEKVMVFPPGEVISNGQTYSYEAKYSVNGFSTSNKAVLEDKIVAKGIELATKIYALLDCQGLSRIDFFLDESGEFWLNEINPIPGFTSISLYPMICQENGLSFQKTVDRLIILALHNHRKKIRAQNFLNKYAKTT